MTYYFWCKKLEQNSHGCLTAHQVLWFVELHAHLGMLCMLVVVLSATCQVAMINTTRELRLKGYGSDYLLRVRTASASFVYSIPFYHRKQIFCQNVTVSKKKNMSKQCSNQGENNAGQ